MTRPNDDQAPDLSFAAFLRALLALAFFLLVLNLPALFGATQ